MNERLDSTCQCTDCPGSTCACGCQGAAAPNLQAAGAACACAAHCGCDGAESGCQCAASAPSA